ncbi:rRNA-processing protein FCF1 [Morella rubra]|uniref:rRNA-processing protein FCF1 n=1 Tax=Morella rubra TaxID=262757 RepID=A0A6A1W663_9ROSI|nr:rRNA-processing protein FCF1 [Morella rubra]
MGKAKKGPKFAVMKKLVTQKAIKNYKQQVLDPKKNDSNEKNLPRNVPKVSSALFFNYNTSLGPPYRVLIDTNFINFSIQNKLDLEKGMMDCLYAKCTPCITDCVMAELEKLGQKYRVALRNRLLDMRVELNKLISEADGLLGWARGWEVCREMDLTHSGPEQLLMPIGPETQQDEGPLSSGPTVGPIEDLAQRETRILEGPGKLEVLSHLTSLGVRLDALHLGSNGFGGLPKVLEPPDLVKSATDLADDLVRGVLEPSLALGRSLALDWLFGEGRALMEGGPGSSAPTVIVGDTSLGLPVHHKEDAECEEGMPSFNKAEGGSWS